ncbi:MAG: hypothetical protein RL111_923 [Pseudomonadota bacterium]|jgi:hypothetical protein
MEINRKRFVAACALVTAGLAGTGLAHAQWAELLKEEGVNAFFDKQSVGRQSINRFAWVLLDLSEPIRVSDKEYASRMERWRIDCAKDTAAVLSVSLFEKAQGKGQELVAFDAPDWRRPGNAIRPSTYVAQLRRQVCPANDQLPSG